MGFSGGSRGRGATCQCRRHKRHRFDPWVGKIPPGVVVQSLCHVLFFATLWNVACQASRSFPISHNLLKLMSVQSVMPFIHLVLCHPLLLLPLICASTRVFFNESALGIKWPKYWSFHLRFSHSNDYSGLVSSRMDWLDLLAVQWTLKSLLQHHRSKALVLWHSAFFMVQLSHPYMTTGTGKNGKVMFLLFNMLSRFVIASLPRSQYHLTSWLQLPSAVILEPKKIKFFTIFIVSPSICHEVMGPDAMIFIF